MKLLSQLIFCLCIKNMQILIHGNSIYCLFQKQVLKESKIICNISGSNVFSKLKFESGVHRVQRVPSTESSGRVHTSAATVAVLPEAEEVDIEIQDKDIRIDVFRSSGPGGQSVNTTDSAVRITHIPTGIVVSQQDEKSQHKNKAKAMKILRSRLLDNEVQQKNKERSEQRKIQVGSGDRSERIRTYNFPQRVSDHRINLTLYNLSEILEGKVEELIEPLIAEEESRKLLIWVMNNLIHDSLALLKDRKIQPIDLRITKKHHIIIKI